MEYSEFTSAKCTHYAVYSVRLCLKRSNKGETNYSRTIPINQCSSKDDMLRSNICNGSNMIYHFYKLEIQRTCQNYFVQLSYLV